MICQAVLQVLGASAADFGLLRVVISRVMNVSGMPVPTCPLTHLGVFRLVWMCL